MITLVEASEKAQEQPDVQAHRFVRDYLTHMVQGKRSRNSRELLRMALDSVNASLRLVEGGK